MVNNSTYINKTKKVLAVMVNNSTFINKTINQFPLQVIEQITNTTYHVEHPWPGFGQTQKCDSIKPVIII